LPRRWCWAGSHSRSWAEVWLASRALHRLSQPPARG
jgi:hypothetical protein